MTGILRDYDDAKRLAVGKYGDGSRTAEIMFS